jgi:hypothetical protein
MSESCECHSYVPALVQAIIRKPDPNRANRGERSHRLSADCDLLVGPRVPSLNTFAVITSDSQSMAARIGVHPQPNESAVA